MREFMRRIYFKPIAMILTILLIQVALIFYLPSKDSYIAYADEILHKDDTEKSQELSENLIEKSTELIDDENILITAENNQVDIILKDFNKSHIVKESDNKEGTESKYDKAEGESNNTKDGDNIIDKDDNASEKPDAGNTGETSGNECSDESNEDVPPEIDNKKQAIVPLINSFAEDMGKNYEKLTASAANINAQGEYTFIILANDKLNLCNHSATNSTLNKWFIPLIELSKGEQKLAYSVDGKKFYELSLDSNNKIPYYMRANITGAPNYTEKERDSILYFKYVEDSDDTAIKIRIHYIPSINANDNTNSGNISRDILKSVSIYGTERVGSTLRAKIKYNNNTDKPKVSYQWLRCKDKNGEYKEIDNADKEEYKLKSNDKGYYLKVKVTISGEISESKESDRTEIIKEKLKDKSSSSNSWNSSSNKYNSGIVVDMDKTIDDQMYLNTSYSSNVDKEIFDLTKEDEKIIPEGNNVVNSDKNFNEDNLNNVDSSNLIWKESMDGKWYLYNNSFIMTGWQKVENNWYYFNEFGVMQKDWVNSNGKWYYLDDNGCMVTGWIKSNNNWYYINSSGEISTGWKEFNKVWYYFNTNGEMQTGWQYIDYRWYYLYPDGAMAYNVEIDGRVLNNNGAAR